MKIITNFFLPIILIVVLTIFLYSVIKTVIVTYNSTPEQELQNEIENCKNVGGKPIVEFKKVCDMYPLKPSDIGCKYEKRVARCEL